MARKKRARRKARRGARKAPRPERPAREPLSPRTRRLLREAAALVLFAASLYLGLSLAAGRTLTGPFGADLRGVSDALLGRPAGYLLALLLGAVGALLVLGRPLRMRGLTGAGLVLSVLSLATLAALPQAERPEAAFVQGGYLGAHLARFLARHLSLFGAYLAAFTLGGIGLMFATDRTVVAGLARLLRALVRFATAPPPEVRPLEEEPPVSRPRRGPPRPPPPSPRAAAAPPEATGKPPSPPPRRPLVRAAGGYVFPPLELLEDPCPVDPAREEAAIRRRAEVLVTALRDFRIQADVVEIQKGPVVTLYELALAPGTKVRQILNLSDDLAMRLKAPSVRIVAPLPGKSTMGVEVPNHLREEVRLKELLTSPAYGRSRAALPLLLGKDVSGNPLVEDLTQMPHLLVAGATGAGKSVCLNAVIMSILLTRRPEEVQLILVDPKMVELSQFRRIPHLMTPVVTDMRRAPLILAWAVSRMEERYGLLHDAGVRHLAAYNRLGRREREERLERAGRDPKGAPDSLPYIVILIDELADLMMANPKEVEGAITRLAQKSRAVGIHLVMATQRPSVDVITGLIKANLPTRIAFKVSSKTDSRIILDHNGAERLLGQGDMLYLPPRTSALRRCQGTFVSDEEVRRVVAHVTRAAQPRFDEDLQAVGREEGGRGGEDPLYEEAVRTVLETGRGSTTLLQRKFQIGYTRAARLVDRMAADGIVGKYKGSQAREVLLTLEEWQRRRKCR